MLSHVSLQEALLLVVLTIVAVGPDLLRMLGVEARE